MATPPPLPRDQTRRRRDEFEQSNRPKSKTPLILASIAGGMLFICCGACGVMGLVSQKQESERMQKEIAEGDRLWEAGDKTGASEKYRPLLHADKIPKDELPRLYGRLIDFAYERGDTKEGKALIEQVEARVIVPKVAHPAAVAATAELKEELKRAKDRLAEEQRSASAKKNESGTIANAKQNTDEHPMLMSLRSIVNSLDNGTFAFPEMEKFNKLPEQGLSAIDKDEMCELCKRFNRQLSDRKFSRGLTERERLVFQIFGEWLEPVS